MVSELGIILYLRKKSGVKIGLNPSKHFNNGYIITWMLHQIFLIKWNLQQAKILILSFYPLYPNPSAFTGCTNLLINEFDDTYPLSIYPRIFYIHYFKLKLHDRLFRVRFCAVYFDKCSIFGVLQIFFSKVYSLIVILL